MIRHPDTVGSICVHPDKRFTNRYTTPQSYMLYFKENPNIPREHTPGIPKPRQWLRVTGGMFEGYVGKFFEYSIGGTSSSKPSGYLPSSQPPVDPFCTWLSDHLLPDECHLLHRDVSWLRIWQRKTIKRYRQNGCLNPMISMICGLSH